MAAATLQFLSDTRFLAETRRKAYQYTKLMFWPNVGRWYQQGGSEFGIGCAL